MPGTISQTSRGPGSRPEANSSHWLGLRHVVVFAQSPSEVSYSVTSDITPTLCEFFPLCLVISHHLVPSALYVPPPRLPVPRSRTDPLPPPHPSSLQSLRLLCCLLKFRQTDYCTVWAANNQRTPNPPHAILTSYLLKPDISN